MLKSVSKMILSPINKPEIKSKGNIIIMNFELNLGNITKIKLLIRTIDDNMFR